MNKTSKLMSSAKNSRKNRGTWQSNNIDVKDFEKRLQEKGESFHAQRRPSKLDSCINEKRIEWKHRVYKSLLQNIYISWLINPGAL